ncbi:hypothetical protein ACEPAG_3597 [Sanghuangporus baumii]
MELLYFHAGWLVGGQRDFQPWWSRWILDLMVKHGAIVVTADHRLILEATCEDVLDDIHDVWDWTGKQPIWTSIPMLNSKGEFTDCSLLAVCAQQHGRILELFGPEQDTIPGKCRMFPEDQIIDGRKLPPTVIIHGVQDSISHVERSDLFVEHLRKHNAIDSLDHREGKEEALTYFRLLGEHLFETELQLGEESANWVKDAAEFIEKNWLS